MSKTNGNEPRNNRAPLIIGIFVVGIAIIITLIVAISLKEEKKNEELVSSKETSEEKEETTQNDVKQEVEEQESVAIQESSEETAKYETAEEWVDSLGLEAPTILVWNAETKEASIIENNQEYQLKENDEVLLTTSGRFDGFQCTPTNVFEGFEPVKQKYMEVFLNIEGKQEVTLELEIAGQKYANTVTLIGTSGEEVDSEGAQGEVILAKESIDTNSQLPGEEWITSIGNEIEDPFIAIWNDTDGSKKILENGERYQLKEGDVFFLYFPKFAYCEMVSPLEVSKKTTLLENGQIFELDIKEEVKVTFTVNVSDNEKVDINCILTK